MKVRSSLKNLKTRDRNNKLIKRKGRLYVINKKRSRKNNIRKEKVRLKKIEEANAPLPEPQQ